MQLSENRCEKVKGILFEARGYYQKINFETSKKLVFLAIELAESRNKDCHRKNLVDAYLRLFYIAKNEDNYEDALKYLLKRKEVVKTFPRNSQYRIRSTISIESDIAILKIKTGAYKEALEKFQKSYKETQKIKLEKSTIETERNLSLQKASLLNSTGDVFIYLYIKEEKNFHLDSASLYYKKAFNLVESLPNPNSDNLVIYQLRRIKILVRKKDYKLALFYLNRYDSLFKKHSNYLSNFYHLKATSLRHEKKYDSAIYFANKYLKLYEPKNKYNKNVILVYDNIANSYLGKKMNDSALFYSNLASEKLKKIEKSKQSTSLKIHNTELAEVRRLNQELREQNKKSTFQKYLITISSILLLIIVLFIKKRNSIKNSTSRKRKIDKKIESEILKGVSLFENTKLFLESDFNISTLANYLETNSTYLSIVINKHKKKPFKQYISELRINYLIEALETDAKLRSYTIQALAEEIGYTNASAFTRAFKKQIGITPSEFLKKI